MRKAIIRSAAAGLAVALVFGAGAARSQVKVYEVGDLVVHDNGGISPRKLPRHEAAPITALLDARVGTKDGAHPPAATSLSIDFDKTLHVNTTGLPACKKGQLLARSTAEARRACGDAIVGSGKGEVEVEFDEQPPFTATGPLLAFNGGTHNGKTLLFVHTYIDVPTPTAVVVETVITKIHRGHYGMHSLTTIPRIAGGAGSVTAFELRLGRRFTYRGRERSYLAASCPTGHYFVEGHALFGDGTRVHLTHVLPCTPTV